MIVFLISGNCCYHSFYSPLYLIKINKFNFLILYLFYSLICDLSIEKECIYWFTLCLNYFYNLFCLTPCVFCPATQSRPPLFIGATLYKTRSKIIFKISIFGKYIFGYEFLYLLLIDLYWAFGVVERSREVIFWLFKDS